MMQLISQYQYELIEAGCDEAGRGCLAGPVFAAAVILPKDFTHPQLTDSKKLSAKQRYKLRPEIEQAAVAWAVQSSDHAFIDQNNILKASVLTMHKAVDHLSIKPGFLIIDGNYFLPYTNIRHKCIVKGDSLYYSIAAASVLAKTYRDDYMDLIHQQYPVYNWVQNKGYPTASHRAALLQHGVSEYHRRSFNLGANQLTLKF